MMDQVERLLFRLRGPLLVLLVLATGLAAWVAVPLKLDADLVKQLPTDQPYIQTALDYRDIHVPPQYLNGQTQLARNLKREAEAAAALRV